MITRRAAQLLIALALSVFVGGILGTLIARTIKSDYRQNRAEPPRTDMLDP